MSPVARAAVFRGPGRPLTIEEFPLVAPPAGGLLARVAGATVCGSDLHAWQGRRASPAPGILGHEIVGVVTDLGPDPPRDLRGEPIRPGDRIVWTEYVACGRCAPCTELRLPQKCQKGRKYGHESAAEPPHLLGGFAEYCYVLPGTGILRVPAELAEAEAAPIACGVATMVAVVAAAAPRAGETVVVQGCGLLGLFGLAMTRLAGAEPVIAVDWVAGRLARARAFGATLCLDASTFDADGLAARIRGACPRGGADAVIETTGVAAAFAPGLQSLRTGGRYVTAGLVVPGALTTFDASLLVRQCLSVRGVHNYRPEDLLAAADFVLAHRTRLPLEGLADRRFPLEDAEGALREAGARRALRPLVVP
jgi:alcohol dehydrogenase